MKFENLVKRFNETTIKDDVYGAMSNIEDIKEAFGLDYIDENLYPRAYWKYFMNNKAVTNLESNLYFLLSKYVTKFLQFFNCTDELPLIKLFLIT